MRAFGPPCGAGDSGGPPPAETRELPPMSLTRQEAANAGGLSDPWMGYGPAPGALNAPPGLRAEPPPPSESNDARGPDPYRGPSYYALPMRCGPAPEPMDATYGPPGAMPPSGLYPHAAPPPGYGSQRFYPPLMQYRPISGGYPAAYSLPPSSDSADRPSPSAEATAAAAALAGGQAASPVEPPVPLHQLDSEALQSIAKEMESFYSRGDPAQGSVSGPMMQRFQQQQQQFQQQRANPAFLPPSYYQPMARPQQSSMQSPYYPAQQQPQLSVQMQRPMPPQHQSLQPQPLLQQQPPMQSQQPPNPQFFSPSDQSPQLLPQPQSQLSPQQQRQHQQFLLQQQPLLQPRPQQPMTPQMLLEQHILQQQRLLQLQHQQQLTPQQQQLQQQQLLHCQQFQMQQLQQLRQQQLQQLQLQRQQMQMQQLQVLPPSPEPETQAGPSPPLPAPSRNPLMEAEAPPSLPAQSQDDFVHIVSEKGDQSGISKLQSLFAHLGASGPPRPAVANPSRPAESALNPMRMAMISHVSEQRGVDNANEYDPLERSNIAATATAIVATAAAAAAASRASHAGDSESGRRPEASEDEGVGRARDRPRAEGKGSKASGKGGGGGGGGQKRMPYLKVSSNEVLYRQQFTVTGWVPTYLYENRDRISVVCLEDETEICHKPVTIPEKDAEFTVTFFANIPHNYVCIYTRRDHSHCFMSSVISVFIRGPQIQDVLSKLDAERSKMHEGDRSMQLAAYCKLFHDLRMALSRVRDCMGWTGQSQLLTIVRNFHAICQRFPPLKNTDRSLDGLLASAIRTALENSVLVKNLPESIVAGLTGILSTYCPLCSQFMERDTIDVHLQDSHSAPPPLKEIPRFYKESAVVSQYIHATIDSTRPTEDHLSRLEEMRQALEEILQGVPFLKDCSLRIFGSSANGFGTMNSDVDLTICLANPNSEESQELLQNRREKVEELAEILRKSDLEGIDTTRRFARIPVLRFKFRGFDCDLSINNVLTLYNTYLLYSYSVLDDRVPILAILVKKWAKLRGFNDPRNGFLCTYGYTLMVLFYLLHKRHPMLYNLQAISPSWDGVSAPQGFDARPVEWCPDHEGKACDVYYYQEANDALVARAKSDNSFVLDLFLGFLKFYAQDFNYREQVISIRSVFEVSKLKKVMVADWNPGETLAIEDPFEILYNVGHTMPAYSLEVLRREMMKTYWSILQALESAQSDEAIYQLITLEQ